MSNPFHLAIPVNDLAKAADFYENILGCDRGRESESWIDFDLFGHQLVCHFVVTSSQEHLNSVDGDNIPVPHFGVILNFDQFDLIAEKLKEKNQTFVVEPKIRFAGQPGEPVSYTHLTLPTILLV